MEAKILSHYDNNNTIKGDALLIRKAGAKEEIDELNSFCQMVYKEREILTGNGKLLKPHVLFGAYHKGEIWGTIGLINKNAGGDLLPTEKIFNLKFPDNTSEICRLTRKNNIRLTARIFTISALISAIILYDKTQEKAKNYIACVKPVTYKLAKKFLGEDALMEQNCHKIREEIIPEEQKIFYLAPPRPIVFLTNRALAKQGCEELEKILNMKIIFSF